MREIKFRAKSLFFDDWVYGFYLEQDSYNAGDKKKKIIIHSGGLIVQDSRKQSATPVKNETVGQYTGMHDKNGKEIYEGDIVEWAGIKMEIFWGEDIGIGYGFCWRPCGDNTGYHESMTGFIDEYEVIGNIYDNPELLEKGKE